MIELLSQTEPNAAAHGYRRGDFFVLFQRSEFLKRS